MGKELVTVTHQYKGQPHISIVLKWLINVVDTNKFVPCWKELRQVVDKVQKINCSSTSTTKEEDANGSTTISMNETKGLIKLRIQAKQYFYSCSITIDDGYPTTTTHEDWGKACRIAVTSTNLAPQIETMVTTRAQKLVRLLQDGIPEVDALLLSNPIQIPAAEDPNEDTTPSKKEPVKNSKTKSATTKQSATTKSQKENPAAEADRKWQSEEQARLAVYNIPDHRDPQLSLYTLVTFLLESISHVPEATCPTCNEPSFPNDPTVLKSLYTTTSTQSTPAQKQAELKRRPTCTSCGCWYHYGCLHTVMMEPPFGGVCKLHKNRRVYHPNWPLDTTELEQAWARKEAKKREMDDMAMFF
jgi:hypothetical protein